MAHEDKGKKHRRIPHAVLRSGGYSYVKDPEHTQTNAEANLKEAEERVETNVSRRKWFGGGKNNWGWQGLGRTNKMMESGKEGVDRAVSDLEKITTYRKQSGYRKGGVVRGGIRKNR